MTNKDLYKQYIENNIPLLLIGKSGTGKSEIIKEIADELGLPVVDLRMSQLPPEDLNGLPAPTDDKKAFTYLLPEWFYKFQPDTPFILAVEPTTQMKYLISIVPTDTDLFDVVKIGETIRIYHTYPITAQTITILSDAQAYSMGNGGAGLTVEDKAFIEAKGYTVKE